MISLTHTAQSFPDLTTTSLGSPEIPTSPTTAAMTCWERILEHLSTRKPVILLSDTQEMHTGGWVSALGMGIFQPRSQSWERSGCTNTWVALWRLAQSGKILLSSCILKETWFFTDYNSTRGCLATPHFIRLDSRCFWKEIGNKSKLRFLFSFY